jgi:hypothetical protein
VLALACALPAADARAAELNEYVGPIHEHTAYSDGAPRTRPSDAFASAKGFGNDFMGLTEHSDTFELPIVTNTDCLSPQIADCVLADQQEPANSFRKWPAMAEQTDAATDSGFVGIRGFEWTNDRHGHLNVLFSSNYTNAKRDGGYLDMGFFWSWFTTPVAQGGGADGLGIFNHPNRRSIGDVVPGGFLSPVDPGTEQPGANWDDFRHVPAADGRMVGIELFNGGTDYGARGGDGDRGWFAHALDRGWHVGAIGAEDAHSPTWGTPEDPKTVVLATGLTRPALREAIQARRFYAIRRRGVTLGFTAGGAQMGSRLQRQAGEPLAFHGTTNVPGGTLELVSSGGATVATAAGELSATRPVLAVEKYYFLRVRDAAGKPVGYSSPVWVETGT